MAETKPAARPLSPHLQIYRIQMTSVSSILTRITGHGIVAGVVLAVALGMASGSVETASNTPMFLILLPFMSSGFVPTGSMPDGLSWFAEHQPFTPMIESVRGLLLGTPIGDSGIVSIAWCVLISVACCACDGAASSWVVETITVRPVRTGESTGGSSGTAESCHALRARWGGSHPALTDGRLDQYG